MSSRRRIPFPLLLALLALAPPLAAREIAGTTLPDTVAVDGTTLVLNGVGVRTKLVANVYVGALYVENRSSDAPALIAIDAPKRVVLRILHSRIDREALVGAWKEGFEANSKARLPSLATRIAQFNALMVDVVAGDEIVVTWRPGLGTTVTVRGADAGTIPGKDFADALFAIWLGPRPVHEGLKKGMLGL